MCSCLGHTLLVPVSNRPPLGIFTLPFPILGGLVTATDHYGMYIGKSAVTAVRHLVSCIQCQVQKTSVYNWIHLCIQYKYITSNGARWGKHTCKFQIKFLEYFQKKKKKKNPFDVRTQILQESGSQSLIIVHRLAQRLYFSDMTPN